MKFVTASRALISPPAKTVVASPTTTWDPSKSSPGVALSGGNLIATHGVAMSDIWESVLSVNGHTTGKYYFELAWSGSPRIDGIFVGIANGSFNFNGGPNIGGDTNAVGYIDYAGGVGEVLLNATNLRTIDAWASVGVAVDLGAKLFWGIALPSGTWNAAGANPATGTGGVDISGLSGIGSVPMYAAATLDYSNASGVIVTANFGNTFTGTKPVGFSVW